MLNEKEYQELWTLIKEVKIGMLISHDGQHLRARPMYTVQDDFDGRLYFFTARNSGKVNEIEQDGEVCIAYERPEEDVYISCSGTARFIKDRGLIEKFWNPFVAAWFPEGKESENIGLVEVSVHKAEIWDADQSAMVQLYEIAKANIMKETPDLGRNRKLGAPDRLH